MISLNYRYIVSQVLPVACIGCWMPGAKEVLGCPRKYFLFVYSSRNISDDLSWSFHQNFSNSSPKIFLTTFFTFSHQLSNFTKTCPLDAPQGVYPGPSHRSHPPLHATESCSDNVQSNGSLSRISKIFVQVELR